MKFFVYVAIERKEAILDPQGKATEHALKSLGFDAIDGTRIGRLVRLSVSAASQEEARAMAEQASQKLLANPIMETFTVISVAHEPMLQRAEAVA